MHKLKNVTILSEVLSILGGMLECQSILTLQQQNKKSKALCSARISKIDWKKNDLYFTVLSLSNCEGFVKEKEILCCSNYKNIVFRGFLQYLHLPTIKVQFPSYIKLIDKRTHLRSSFDQLQIPIHCSNVSKVAYQSAHMEKAQGTLIDVGERGVALTFGEKERDLFKKGDQVQITSIASDDSYKIKGQVSYVNSLRRRSKEIFRIGLKTQSKIKIENVVATIDKYHLRK